MKPLFIIALFLGITLNLFAQDNSKFGVKGGLNFSNHIGNKNHITDNLRIGYNIGFYYSTKISDKWAF